MKRIIFLFVLGVLTLNTLTVSAISPRYNQFNRYFAKLVGKRFVDTLKKSPSATTLLNNLYNTKALRKLPQLDQQRVQNYMKQFIAFIKNK